MAGCPSDSGYEVIGQHLPGTLGNTASLTARLYAAYGGEVILPPGILGTAGRPDRWPCHLRPPQATPPTIVTARNWVTAQRRVIAAPWPEAIPTAEEPLQRCVIQEAFGPPQCRSAHVTRFFEGGDSSETGSVAEIKHPEGSGRPALSAAQISAIPMRGDPDGDTPQGARVRPRQLLPAWPRRCRAAS